MKRTDALCILWEDVRNVNTEILAAFLCAARYTELL